MLPGLERKRVFPLAGSTQALGRAVRRLRRALTDEAMLSLGTAVWNGTMRGSAGGGAMDWNA